MLPKSERRAPAPPGPASLAGITGESRWRLMGCLTSAGDERRNHVMPPGGRCVSASRLRAPPATTVESGPGWSIRAPASDGWCPPTSVVGFAAGAVTTRRMPRCGSRRLIACCAALTSCARRSAPGRACISSPPSPMGCIGPPMSTLSPASAPATMMRWRYLLQSERSSPLTLRGALADATGAAITRSAGPSPDSLASGGTEKPPTGESSAGRWAVWGVSVPSRVCGCEFWVAGMEAGSGIRVPR